MTHQRRTAQTDSTEGVSLDLLQAMYRTMVSIRVFEERVAELLEQGEIRCPTHLYIGQEAIATGVCAALRREDYIFGNHRSHGHYLAKGADMNKMMAELFGKQTGCSMGRGGSMHLIAPEVGVMGTVPIVSGTVPLAVGAALASKLRGVDRVSVTFFGDGTMEEGTVHESMNMAASTNLPVIFVCENNLYSSHMQILERRAKDNLAESAEAHGMQGMTIDGNDAIAVYKAATEAVSRAMAGKGPSFLECRTFRWRGHVGPAWDMDVGVKRKGELSDWLKKDPVERLMKQLAQEGVSIEDLEEVTRQVHYEVKESEIFARESPYPDAEELLQHIFTDSENQAD